MAGRVCEQSTQEEKLIGALQCQPPNADEPKAETRNREGKRCEQTWRKGNAQAMQGGVQGANKTRYLYRSAHDVPVHHMTRRAQATAPRAKHQHDDGFHDTGTTSLMSQHVGIGNVFVFVVESAS
eukprot:scaffold19520_cov124-Isochrysis_galbana.AAC.1